MKDKIVQYLIQKYQPDAIILHGSRARGYERELSDWDIILLYNASTEIKSGRELFENQNIELSVHVLPIGDIYETFVAKLQHAKVLYENSNIGTVLLTQANEFYKQGVHWSEDKFEAHKLWFQGRLDGMRNYLDNPVIFYKYFGDLYDRIFNYWYWLHQHQHSQPIYIALEETKGLDPEYYSLVEKLTDQDTTLAEKLAICEKIKDRLFIPQI